MVSTVRKQVCGVKSSVSSRMCAAMEDTAEPDYLSALPDVNPADTHHQYPLFSETPIWVLGL